MSFNPSLSDALSFFEKIKKNFEDFKPETKSLDINFSNKTCNVGLAIKVDNGFRKNHNKIKIPAYAGFKIIRTQDALFNHFTTLWKNIDDHWILDCKDLPPSDGYFVELEGAIDPENLKDLVHIRQSINSDSNDEVDKYWLDASLKSPKKLEKIWTELQINNVGVNVDIHKLFGLQIPQEIKDKSNAIQKYLNAGRKGERGEIFNTMHDFKRQERKTPFHTNDFLQIIQSLTTRETMLEYLSVDQSYNIGDVEHPTRYEGIFPQDIKVQTLTRLTLDNPISNDYLILHRKLYLEKIKEKFDEILKKK